MANNTIMRQYALLLRLLRRALLFLAITFAEGNEPEGERAVEL